MNNLAFLSAAELATKIKAKEISSMELTDHFINRIERFDNEINAVVVRDFDRALAAATQADKLLAKGVDMGPLHGVPITIKEAFNISGLATTWGIPVLKNNIADQDAEVVNRLKRAGAIFMGKTNVPLGLGDYQSYNDIYGTTNNPWDLNCSPGGSSGGSAAALAAGLCALEIGSDIGGSIRVPAHFCGLYGHKPTWGIISDKGHALPGMLASTDLGVVGPMARSAGDLRLALDLLAGADPLNQTGWELNLPRACKKSLREYRVAIWSDDELAPVDEEISKQLAEIGEVLTGLGATVSDVARPEIDFKQHQITYMNLLWSVMGAHVGDEEYLQACRFANTIPVDDFSDTAVSARARALSHRDWLTNNNKREYLRYAWREFFTEWDVLICPIFALPAFAHDHGSLGERVLSVNGVSREYFQSMFWAGLSTTSFLPSTAFPAGLSQNGRPIGFQVISAEFNDYVSIDFANLLEKEIGGFQKPPAYES